MLDWLKYLNKRSPTYSRTKAPRQILGIYPWKKQLAKYLSLKLNSSLLRVLKHVCSYRFVFMPCVAGFKSRYKFFTE